MIMQTSGDKINSTWIPALQFLAWTGVSPVTVALWSTPKQSLEEHPSNPLECQQQFRPEFQKGQNQRNGLYQLSSQFRKHTRPLHGSFNIDKYNWSRRASHLNERRRRPQPTTKRGGVGQDPLAELILLSDGLEGSKNSSFFDSLITRTVSFIFSNDRSDNEEVITSRILGFN